MNHLKNINWDGETFGFDLTMINDHARNRFYQQSLGNCQGQIVLDIGSGTGILSVLAVQAGARHVYSFERDQQNFLAVTDFIKSSGLKDHITVICADILEVDRYSWPHDPIDVIITETFANDCFIENFAFLVEHVECSFNLAPHHRWIPENIELFVSLVNVDPCEEFDPGIPLPTEYTNQIHSAIQIYRDHFYRPHDQINLPVSQIPQLETQHMICLQKFIVCQALRDQLSVAKFRIHLDHHIHTNPYLKVDWRMNTSEHQLWINKSASWRSIGFKINPNNGKEFYLRFNPLTNAFIASQSCGPFHEKI
jgi:predicted RNA methylase